MLHRKVHEYEAIFIRELQEEHSFAQFCELITMQRSGIGLEMAVRLGVRFLTTWLSDQLIEEVLFWFYLNNVENSYFVYH